MALYADVAGRSYIQFVTGIIHIVTHVTPSVLFLGRYTVPVECVVELHIDKMDTFCLQSAVDNVVRKGLLGTACLFCN